MHRKRSNEGLVVITVALDPLEDEAAEVKGRVLKFLTKQQATFTNLLLDETDEVWQKKLRFESAPSVFLFNRQGKWAHFKAQDLEDDPMKLDRMVDEFLKEK